MTKNNINNLSSLDYKNVINYNIPFSKFIYKLREEWIKASTSEILNLQKVLNAWMINSIESFYNISKALLIKRVDQYYDFNRIFISMFISKYDKFWNEYLLDKYENKYFYMEKQKYYINDEWNFYYYDNNNLFIYKDDNWASVNKMPKYINYEEQFNKEFWVNIDYLRELKNKKIKSNDFIKEEIFSTLDGYDKYDKYDKDLHNRKYNTEYSNPFDEITNQEKENLEYYKNVYLEKIEREHIKYNWTYYQDENGKNKYDNNKYNEDDEYYDDRPPFPHIEYYDDDYNEWDYVEIDLKDFPNIDERNKFLDELDKLKNDTSKKIENIIDKKNSENKTNEEIKKPISDVQQEVLEQVHKTIQEEKKIQQKEQLWTQEITDNIPQWERNWDEEESKHWWDEDQHNDILRQNDINKIWWGDLKQSNQKLTKSNPNNIWWWEWEKKLEKEWKKVKNKNNNWGCEVRKWTQFNWLWKKIEESIKDPKRWKNKKKLKSKKKKKKKLEYKISEEREKISYEFIQKTSTSQFNPNTIISDKYFTILLNRLNRIIHNSTTKQTDEIDIEKTIDAISESWWLPKLIHKEAITQRPKLTVLVDVWWSVDAYRSITLKLLKSMGETNGLDIEVYYFHNAIYGYVWPEKDWNWRKSEININKILKWNRDWKCIIIWDAWMSRDEFFGKWNYYNEEPKDHSIPYLTWEDSFNKVKKHFWNHVVFVNPLLEEKHEEEDRSWTIEATKEIFDMYELTYRWLEWAITQLVR